jgi:hypothetical protein
VKGSRKADPRNASSAISDIATPSVEGTAPEVGSEENLKRLTQAVGTLPSNKLKGVVPDVALDRPSNQATARLAAEILGAGGAGFVVPTARQREALLVAFVREGYVIYGKAFDVVRIGKNIDLANENEIRRHIDEIVLYEIKSTSKANIPRDFRGYFFSLSTAELLVAQNLGPRYRFAFVNTRTRTHMELSLTELFARSRGIYPSWSVMF